MGTRIYPTGTSPATPHHPLPSHAVPRHPVLSHAVPRHPTPTHPQQKEFPAGFPRGSPSLLRPPRLSGFSQGRISAETPKDSPSPRLRRGRGIPAAGFCCKAGAWLCLFGGTQGLASNFWGDTGAGFAFLGGHRGWLRLFGGVQRLAFHRGTRRRCLWRGRRGWLCAWGPQGLASAFWGRGTALGTRGLASHLANRGVGFSSKGAGGGRAFWGHTRAGFVIFGGTWGQFAQAGSCCSYAGCAGGTQRGWRYRRSRAVPCHRAVQPCIAAQPCHVTVPRRAAAPPPRRCAMQPCSAMPRVALPPCRAEQLRHALRLHGGGLRPSPAHGRGSCGRLGWRAPGCHRARRRLRKPAAPPVRCRGCRQGTEGGAPMAAGGLCAPGPGQVCRWLAPRFSFHLGFSWTPCPCSLCLHDPSVPGVPCHLASP